jgi:tetratricopeptide (TPR) repeat protein
MEALPQTRFAQVGSPSGLLSEELVLWTNRWVNHLQTELRVKPQNFRRFGSRGIVVAELNIARAEAEEVERRTALNPNSAVGYLALAIAMDYMVEPAQALVAMEKVIRLDPGGHENYYSSPDDPQGWAYTSLGRYEDATSAFKRDLTVHPGVFWVHLGLVIDDSLKSGIASS